MNQLRSLIPSGLRALSALVLGLFIGSSTVGQEWSSRFRYGPCPIPPGTKGEFFPIPYSWEAYLVKVDYDRLSATFQILPGLELVTLRIVDMTRFRNSRNLSDLKLGDYARVEFIEDAPSNLDAISIQKLPVPPITPVTLEGSVSEIQLRPDGSSVISLASNESFLTGARTSWRGIKDASELLPGHKLIATSLERQRSEEQGNNALLLFANIVEVPDPDHIDIMDKIKALNLDASYLQLDNFPASIFAERGDLQNLSTDEKVRIEANRGADGRWSARTFTRYRVTITGQIVKEDTDRSVPEFPVFSEVPMPFKGFFEWTDPAQHRWPSTPDGLSIQQMRSGYSFTYGTERKYHPIFWILSFGLAAIAKNHVFDLSFTEKGEAAPLTCTFEVDKKQVPITLDSIKNYGFTLAKK